MAGEHSNRQSAIENRQYAVSVVIPTYNAETFLHDTLQSVFAQTIKPQEIIVADDSSTDKTRELVNSLARDAPVPLRLIEMVKNSGGPSGPLNAGIESSRCEIIATLDQDDLMRPLRLEAQTRALSTCPQCTVVIGRFAVIGSPEGDFSRMWPVTQFFDLSAYIDEQTEYSVIESEIAFRPLFNRNYAGSASNLCFSKTWWARLGKFDERSTISSDLDFMLKATAAGPIAVVNETLFDYRIRQDSLLRSNNLRSDLDATMTRLRAASANPAWAREHLQSLRHSALSTGLALLKQGDLKAGRLVAETLLQHKGFEAVKHSLKKKKNRLLGG